MQVYTYPFWNVTETGPGQYSADTSGMTDSLFTVDMNLDGTDDPGHWYKIYKEHAPTFNNPITFNSFASFDRLFISFFDKIEAINNTTSAPNDFDSII